MNVQQHAAVIADLLDASASLSGLALVFLGMIATATATNEPGEKTAVAEKARRPVYAFAAGRATGELPEERKALDRDCRPQSLP